MNLINNEYNKYDIGIPNILKYNKLEIGNFDQIEAIKCVYSDLKEKTTPGEFEIEFDIEGTGYVSIEAKNYYDAKEQADDITLDELDDKNVYLSVSRIEKVFDNKLVTQNKEDINQTELNI